jgi:CubicO group peptidase (beta-lactamase class C family)
MKDRAVGAAYRLQNAPTMRLSTALAAALVAAVPSIAAADPTTIVTNKINNYKASRAFMGAVVVVVKGGNYYWFNFGWKDATTGISVTTPVAIASNTKTFVATSLALSDTYGPLPKSTELDAAFSMLVGSVPAHATLQDLVSYYSGLPRDMPYTVTSVTDLIDSLDVCQFWSDPCFAPETQNVYSNYGFEVLGNILSLYSNFNTWSDMNEAQITGPLGMTKTCARGDGCHPNFASSHAHAFDFAGNDIALPSYNDITAPEGGLWSTAEDMAVWLRYQLGLIPSTSPEITKLNAVLPMMKNKLPSGSGWSWQIKQLTFNDGTTSKVRWKLGRYKGLNSYIGLADNRQTGVFVFVNRDGSDPSIEDPSDVLRDELGEKILEAFP